MMKNFMKGQTHRSRGSRQRVSDFEPEFDKFPEIDKFFSKLFTTDVDRSQNFNEEHYGQKRKKKAQLFCINKLRGHS